MKNQIIRIIIFSLIIGLFGLYMNDRGIIVGTKADVVGNLKFTYPGGTTPETLFNEGDFKPGDCQDVTVSVENLSGSNSIVGVFSDGEVESDGLSSALEITIWDNGNALYGPVPLSQFFADSDVENQINLLTLPGNGTVDLRFEVCFPNTDDNELQGDEVVFDLKFGQITPPIELPDECEELEGIVTAKIEGTSGNDFILGTSASEFIETFAGNDWVWGGGGDDCIITSEGRDRVAAGSGNDIVIGGAGRDRVAAQSGNDQVLGGEGNDRISGGAGEDTLFGNEGNDRISGGSQDDYLDGGPNFDRISGGSGTDTCVDGEILSSCEF